MFSRDLEWTLRSPALLSLPECVGAFTEREIQAILQTARAPAKPEHKLGRYFEQLVQPIAQHLSTSVFHNIVLKQEKQTLGEMDLVFQDPHTPDTTQHWEVAIKFYLCQTADHPQLSDYLGPQGRDRLDLKLHKLRTRQLTLAQTPQARAWLAAHKLPTTVQSQLFVKGRLFYPADSDWRTIPAPPEVDSNHLRGWWARTRIPESFGGNGHWVILPKINWISGIATGAHSTPLTGEELNLRLKKEQLPVSVAELKQDNAHWHELSRGMIVDSRWGLNEI